MRKFGTGLAAAVAVAMLSVGAVATHAVAAKDKTAEVDAKALERGKAEGPAAAQAAKVSCQVTNGRWIGQQKDKATKATSDFYEVACDQGLGFIIDKKSDGTATAYNCLAMSAPGADGKPNPLACKLPENADPKVGFAALVAKGGKPCTVEKARAIGDSASKSYFEVACQGGDGYVVETDAPASAAGAVKMSSCLLFEAGGNLSCTLTTKEEQLAVVDTLNTAAAKNCQIKDRRYVMTSQAGDRYFEVSCADGKGYMLQQGADTKLVRAIDCANASFVDGGCRMTDAVAAQTEQASLYTRLSKKGGFDCDVSKYALLPVPGPKEVVELQCSNQPVGKIGVFQGTSATFLDCAHAEIAGYRCSLNKEPYDYSGFTADLKTFGKGSCTVSKTRLIGATADGTAYMEVACSDGLPGWVLTYPGRGTKAGEVLSCLQAKGIGGGCKLPTNATKG